MGFATFVDSQWDCKKDVTRKLKVKFLWFFFGQL